ncbi:MAG: hypothetical protein EPN38_05520 [Rhodanobacteraceae bacterium]|nr:MAG: hypothetical protein EPN38_05520 [Rhodanobacteraceae bacterium]
MNTRTKTFSLRTRLTVLLALAVLVALGGAAKIVDWRADAEMHQRFDASLLTRAEAFAALVRGHGNNVEIDAMADQLGRFPGGDAGDWYAVTCAGQRIAQSDPAPPAATASGAPRYLNTSVPGHPKLRMVVLRFAPGVDAAGTGAALHSTAATCELRYALDRASLDELLRALDWILLGSLLGACVLVILLTPWLVARGLRPLALLARAMAAIGPDAPGGRLPASSTSELVPLVGRFNEVLARMDAGLARERQFASGLAHEFRTRLAELRALVEVESRYPSGRDPCTILGEVGGIGAELEATVTALLQLTRIQSGLERPHCENVLLQPLLKRVQARHRDMAQARGVGIESDFDCDPACTLDTDPALLEIVLDNLLGNAVAYAPAGSTVTLRIRRDLIEVRNLAPSLQPGDIANFGQRFWRKGSQGAGHAGLGLALASAASHALGVGLDFRLEGGALCATLSLQNGPSAAAPADDRG